VLQQKHAQHHFGRLFRPASRPALLQAQGQLILRGRCITPLEEDGAWVLEASAAGMKLSSTNGFNPSLKHGVEHHLGSGRQEELLANELHPQLHGQNIRGKTL
jgi:hypothetical protein